MRERTTASNIGWPVISLNTVCCSVEISYYEGAEYLLVQLRSGKETRIHAPPHYSPNEKWLVAVCGSLGLSGCGNGIDSVPAATDDPSGEWHYLVPDNESAIYAFAGWDGDDRVRLSLTFPVSEFATKTVPASVVRVGGTWRLEVPQEYRSRVR